MERGADYTPFTGGCGLAKIRAHSWTGCPLAPFVELSTQIGCELFATEVDHGVRSGGAEKRAALCTAR